MNNPPPAPCRLHRGRLHGRGARHASRAARADLAGSPPRAGPGRREVADDLGFERAFGSPKSCWRTTPSTSYTSSPRTRRTLDSARSIAGRQARRLREAAGHHDRRTPTRWSPPPPQPASPRPCRSSTASTRWCARPGPAFGRRGGASASIHGSYLQDWLLAPPTTTGGSTPSWAGRPGRSPTSDRTCVTSSSSSPATGSPGFKRLKRTVFDERAAHRGITTEDLVAVAGRNAQRRHRHPAGLAGRARSQEPAAPRDLRLRRDHRLRPGAARDAVARPSYRFPAAAPQRRELGADAVRLSILPPGHPLGYQDAFNAFVADSYAAVAGDRRDGLPTFDDGLRAVRLTDAVLDSARVRHLDRNVKE